LRILHSKYPEFDDEVVEKSDCSLKEVYVNEIAQATWLQ
jgi:hypothetical protein